MSYLVEVKTNFQIKFPKAIRESISLKTGDILRFDFKNGELLVKPLDFSAIKKDGNINFE